MSNDLRVYLDHLIKRESLRYQRPNRKPERERWLPNPNKGLELRDLQPTSTSSREKYLRKPDFQRSTWAWTPEDCLLLLESLYNGQVIPSIIMWSNEENGIQYILDGGHRISVVLAWLRNEWEDPISSRPDRDINDEIRIKRAAQEVRKLVKAHIGEISEFKAAAQELDELLDEAAEVARHKMGERRFKQARFYQRLLMGEIAFHILWVEGNYQKAEQSFLRINKSGRQLTDWETKLVENRNSSLARIVMSLTSLESLAHYWPGEESEQRLDSALLNKREMILENLHYLHDLLFSPPYQPDMKRLYQPFFAITDVNKKPYYLAELFTIIQGGKGYETETRKLLEVDRDASPTEIIERGYQLIEDTIEVFTHLIGANWQSLSIIPVVYFYTESGKYVRSLLYGMIYWLFAGTDEEILDRKRLFTLHRAKFEQILLDNKEDVVGGIGRKTGSGTEITAQTAQYFHTVLELLIKYNDDIDSEGFMKEYEELTDDLTGRRKTPRSQTVSSSPSFTPRQKSTKMIQAHLNWASRCEICGGFLDPQMGVQHDHITQRFRGGSTTLDNQRIVHPFCNHEREVIEAAQQGKKHISLPAFVDSLLAASARQIALPLVFFDDRNFLSPYDRENE
ncbi:MAG: DUF262 domain-containing protein [Anaerolineae bacterium]|nr:DUF262 domain-containing protein [Anaerolineae bacterium]